MSSPFGGEPRSADPYIASSVCGLIISILAIALRFWSRLISKTPIQWDDWAALAALPFALTVVGLTFGAVKENAAMPTPNSPEATIQLFTFAKHFLYMNIVYDFGITFVKLSALLFYFRVFGRTIHSFRIALQVAGISCVLWLFITVITELFMCSLFAPVWILGTPSSQTKCLDTYVLMIGTSAANVVLDIVILVLPHFLLYKLQMGLWKKVGLVGVFICAYRSVRVTRQHDHMLTNIQCRCNVFVSIVKYRAGNCYT